MALHQTLESAPVTGRSSSATRKTGSASSPEALAIADALATAARPERAASDRLIAMSTAWSSVNGAAPQRQAAGRRPRRPHGEEQDT